MLKEKGAPRGEVFPYKLSALGFLKLYLVVDGRISSFRVGWGWWENRRQMLSRCFYQNGTFVDKH